MIQRPIRPFALFTVLLLGGAAMLANVRSSHAADDRPNIVIIMADDMGFSDIGCYGSEIETPNLDALAAGGLRFTQFYNTARCCPTRATLLTGLYSHQAGVGHMVEDRGLPGYRGFLNDRSVTIAEVLRESGYRTFMSGKWHVGEKRPHWPVDRGFDRSYALVSGGTNYFRLDPNRTLAIDDQQIQPPADWYVTDAITDHAVQFVREHDKPDQPFFMYVAYTAPHWPLHAPQDLIAKYRGKYKRGWDELRKERHARMVEMGLVKADWPITQRDPAVPAWNSAEDKDELDLRMAVYAAQIDRMDQGIGKLVSQLKESGRYENTLILFLADNGGCAEIIDRSADKQAPTGVADSFRSYGVGWANASNTPFRRYKHWVHEGGISSPLVAHWPKTIGNASITHQPAHLIDLMATCVDLGRAEYPKTRNGKNIHPLPGQSLKPILSGQNWDTPRTLYWEHEGNRAVRQGDWKLVAAHGKDWELYDLAANRTETANQASEHPEKVKELAALYDQWASNSNVVPWNELPNPGGAKKGGNQKAAGKKAGKNKAKAASAAAPN
jgi:arylsulfatase A-like enzyme